MLRIYTLILNAKRFNEKESISNNFKLLQKDLNDIHEPSPQIIRNILSFSDAYSNQKSNAIGDIELIVN